MLATIIAGVAMFFGFKTINGPLRDEAVFSDIEWTEPTIYVWPSNTASMHADPAQAIAWLRRASTP